MVENLLLGLDVALSVSNLFYLLVGVVLGTVIGVLPGIGPSTTISLLLPLTFSLGPIPSIIMLAGIYYGSQYGGSTTAILLNTPGESSSVMTCIDGYKMTSQGRAGVAITAAAISSFIAGLIMVIVMAAISPPLSELAFKFGPAEYTLLMIFGFVSITLLTGNDMIKGLSITILGILFGIIGIDINSGVERFTLNFDNLTEGIIFSIIAISFFAIPEIIKNIENPIKPGNLQLDIKILPTGSDLKRIIPSSLRGTLVGGFLGLIPGGGITVSSYAAYIVDKKLSKNKDEIGKGAIEGVAAPEAANNAAAQAGFIPLLAIGIPENAVMALILASMIVSGIVPGPMVISNHPELFWGLAVSMVLGNLALLILNLPLVKVWAKIIEFPSRILYPSVLAICFLGTYFVTKNIDDLLVLTIVSLLGYVTVKLGLSPVNFILGFVLGPMLEENFRRALSISQGDFSIFYSSSVSITLIIIISIVLSVGMSKIYKEKTINNSNREIINV